VSPRWVPEAWSRRWSQFRTSYGKFFEPDLFIAMAGIVGMAILLRQFNQHIPVRNWLFWRYAAYCVAAACWATALLVFGHAVLNKLKRVQPSLEHALFAMVIGVVGFYCFMFLAGIVGVYGPWCFFGIPLLMFALGARGALEFVRTQGAQLRAVWREALPVRSPLSIVVCGLGGLAIVAIYLSITVLKNSSYDSHWYHLGLAEQYALAGRVPRFPQGWFMGAYPHLATYLYTWAFLAPKTLLFDRVLLAAHLEMVLFLWTLVGVTCLARALLESSPHRPRHAWAALFLFPGIFLYDSSLCLGADHVAAFFAAPAYIAFLRSWSRLETFYCGLLAVCLAGAISTKYSAFTLVLFPVVVVCLRAGYLVTRRMAQKEPRVTAPLVSLSIAAFFALLVLVPHWAKNWVFYGDPLYPMLHSYLSLDPWAEGMDYRYAQFRALAWRPAAGAAGVVATVKSVVNFSFIPNDWPRMHGSMPVFGSLFTVSTLMLPFLGKKSMRAWGLFAGTNLGVAAWYWVQHEDRYLQALVPWMAAAVSAVLILAWSAGWLSKLVIAGLVIVQAVWGLHVYFIPTHSQLGKAPIQAFSEMAAAAYENKQQSVLHKFEAEKKVGQQVNGGTLWLHQVQPQLGFGVRVLHDNALNQGGLVYGRVESPQDLWKQLSGYGVTHILWIPGSVTEQSLADDIVFFDFVENHTAARFTSGDWTVAKMERPREGAQKFAKNILLYSCTGDGYAPGFYQREDLLVLYWDERPQAQFPKPRQRIEPGADRRPLLQRADAVVVNPRCNRALSTFVREDYSLLRTRGALEIWRKRAGR